MSESLNPTFTRPEAQTALAKRDIEHLIEHEPTKWQEITSGDTQETVLNFLRWRVNRIATENNIPGDDRPISWEWVIPSPYNVERALTEIATRTGPEDVQEN